MGITSRLTAGRTTTIKGMSTKWITIYTLSKPKGGISTMKETLQCERCETEYDNKDVGDDCPVCEAEGESGYIDEPNSVYCNDCGRHKDGGFCEHCSYMASLD